MLSNGKTFNTGIYLRLSRDDGTDKESESIQNQKSFLLKYVTDADFLLADIYIDDGWSGTNFNRPDFKRLIHDIEQGKINCVVTKDLSRLGRDYIMTGHYIEKYFPQHNVRYIAVNDGVDTFENSVNNDMTPFKAVFNDMYAKDISKKVRTSLDVKKRNGEFVGSVAPYGYKKNPDNKNELIIDELTAINVRRIFSMYLDGYSAGAIAQTFTEEQIPTPSQVKHLTATQQELYKGVWNRQIIMRILSSPTYMGNLTQNRARKINYKIDAQKKLPRSEWVIVENTHEPIISKEDFSLVQKIIASRGCQTRGKERYHLLSGLLRCSDCGKGMTFSSDRDGRSYIVCRVARVYYKEHLCTPHRIREDSVEREVIRQLRAQAQKYLDKDRIIGNSRDEDAEQVSLRKTVTSLEKRLSELSDTITKLYIDKAKGIIGENNFIAISSRLDREKEQIDRQLNETNERLTCITAVSRDDAEMRKQLEAFLSFNNPDRNTLFALIDKIEVYNDKTFKIFFSFNVGMQS